MNALLTDKIGSQFITIWKQKSLQASLGLPTARNYVKLQSSWLQWNSQRYSLAMQRGTLVITCDSQGKCQ